MERDSGPNLWQMCHGRMLLGTYSAAARPKIGSTLYPLAVGARGFTGISETWSCCEVS